MTMATRAEVYDALFALVEPLGPKGAPGQRIFKTVSQETIEVQNVDPGEQPVLFMDQAFEENVYQGADLKYRLWTVYFHIGCCTAKGTAASTVLNPLIEAVEAALRSTVPDEEQQLGLGDKVTAVRCKGVGMKDLGQNSTDADKRQAVYYLPVEIVLPAN